MIPERYVWFVWALSSLIPWVWLYARLPHLRRAMVWTSVFAAPFGLAEPLFIPAYWNPPTLFDLGRRTGCDIESIIYAFGLGGVCAVLYNVVMHTEPQPIAPVQYGGGPRLHYAAMATPFLLFMLLGGFP